MRMGGKSIGLTVMHNCYCGEDLQTMYLYSLSSFLFILLLFLFSVCLVQNWSSAEQTSDAGGGQTHVKTQGRANNPYLYFRWSCLGVDTEYYF